MKADNNSNLKCIAREVARLKAEYNKIDSLF